MLVTPDIVLSILRKLLSISALYRIVKVLTSSSTPSELLIDSDLAEESPNTVPVPWLVTTAGALEPDAAIPTAAIAASAAGIPHGPIVLINAAKIPGTRVAVFALSSAVTPAIIFAVVATKVFTSPHIAASLKALFLTAIAISYTRNAFSAAPITL